MPSACEYAMNDIGPRKVALTRALGTKGADSGSA